MRRTNATLLGTGILLLAAACSSGADEPLGTTESDLIVRPLPPGKIGPSLPPAADQSFLPPTTFATGMVMNDGWTAATPRVLADVDGDKKQDVVGFGDAGVWVARSNGATGTPTYVLADFGSNQGWSTAKHVRLLGDIDGDGKDDIVGFGDGGVYTSLSDGSGYGQAHFIIADLGYDQGWRVDQHPRVLADVNGDGKKDIVAFGDGGVFVALATGGGAFENPPRYVMADFGVLQGWDATKHIRVLGDINGDGKDDIVGFGETGVTVAYSNGYSFDGLSFVLAAFGYSAGSWRGAAYPRMLADLNHDGKQDIVGFGDAGVWTALATGTGFGPATFAIADFGVNQEWTSAKNPRFATDINGDGYADIVGFGADGIHRALGGPAGFSGPLAVLRDLGELSGYHDANHPRLLGDMDGDGLVDAVGFGSAAIQVARSTTQPWPGPPPMPDNTRFFDPTSTSIWPTWSHGGVNNERSFYLWWGKSGETKTKVVLPGSVTAKQIGGLSPSTTYCFQVQAENDYGITPLTSNACSTTLPDTSGGGGGGGGGGSITICGITLQCASGYHPDRYQYSQACPGRGVQDNATVCAKNFSVYHACGEPNCAAGYHPTRFDYSAGCNYLASGNIDPNASTCEQNSAFFTTCGACPAGWQTTAVTADLQCDLYPRSTCQQ